MHYDYDREIFFENAKEFVCGVCGKTYVRTYAYREYFLTLEEFMNLKRTYDYYTLVDYLPEDLKKSYIDAIDVMRDEELSHKVKMGAVVLLLATFMDIDVKNINFEDIVAKAISMAKTELGVSVSKEKLAEFPDYMLNTIEALLTKKYLILAKKERLKQEYEEKVRRVDEKLSVLLENLE
ncbi:MAG: hypothetical protein LBQ34_01205 [Alphaproteobacteria bacterium]|jgi:hypothetical protein|nr:hypothetical protein [Alphaproteobacteria bacterium]